MLCYDAVELYEDRRIDTAKIRGDKAHASADIISSSAVHVVVIAYPGSTHSAVTNVIVEIRRDDHSVHVRYLMRR